MSYLTTQCLQGTRRKDEDTLRILSSAKATIQLLLKFHVYSHYRGVLQPWGPAKGLSCRVPVCGGGAPRSTAFLHENLSRTLDSLLARAQLISRRHALTSSTELFPPFSTRTHPRGE